MVLSSQYKDCVPFIPDITSGKVIKVYDGDTITISSKLPYDASPLYRWSVRLKGIDSPEMKSKNKTEKECARIAQKTLSDFIFEKEVELKNVQMEKYGRILADVYCENINLSTFMLAKRLAVPYDGKTKKCPENWIEFYCKE